MVASVVVHTADRTGSGLFCLTRSSLIKQFVCRKSFVFYCYRDLQDLLNKKVYYFLGMFMNNYFCCDEVIGSSRRCLYLIWILIHGWRLDDKVKPILDNSSPILDNSSLIRPKRCKQHCSNDQPSKLKLALESRPDCYQCCYHLGVISNPVHIYTVYFIW